MMSIYWSPNSDEWCIQEHISYSLTISSFEDITVVKRLIHSRPRLHTEGIEPLVRRAIEAGMRKSKHRSFIS